MIRKIIRAATAPFPSIALFLRNTRDSIDRSAAPKPTPWGFSLAGHESMAAGIFEPKETMLVRKLLQEADVLVNIGANVGYYCCHALSLGVPVVAVEPVIRNLHYLLNNIRDNGWANQAQVFPVALGQQTDILHIYGGGTGASLVKGWASTPESYATQVPVLTLDRVLGNSLQEKRALILVDIEGAEFMMLQGAQQTLENQPRPIWVLEISTSEHQPAGTTMNPNFSNTFDVFFESGYEACTADEEMRQITRRTVSEIVDGKQKLTTHNFLFR